MLDATVLFAGIGWPRWSYEILRHAAREDFQLVLTPRIIAQARRNLQAKVPSALSQFDAWLKSCRSEMVDEPNQTDVDTNQQLVRQPEDVPIALAAIRASVDYFVSDDKDFTAQDASTRELHRRLTILRPVIFLREVMGWTSEELEQVRQRRWGELGDAPERLADS